MSQQVIIAIGDPVVSESLQEIFSSLSTPGILTGMQLTTTDPSTLAIEPGTALTDSGVFIFESELITYPITLTVAPANYTVYYAYINSNNFGGNPAVLTVQAGLIPAAGFINGVILGWIQYPGGSVGLNPQSMFISAPRFQLMQDPSKLPNNFSKTFAPLSPRWSQVSFSGGLTTTNEFFDPTYNGPITQVTNNGTQLAGVTYVVPVQVPLLGLSQIEVELETDGPTSVTVTVLDSQGNLIIPIGPSNLNEFTNTPMMLQTLRVPFAAGLTPNSEAYIQLAIQIQPGYSVRFKSVGVSSYSDPF
jgi:hypothetical protein